MDEFKSAAMMVAASDHPREFQKKRDMISETRFSGHDHQLMNSEDDETTPVAKVLKAKEILGSSDVSEAVLLESLLKLQQMVKSVSVLKLTGVGISVNRLRNHASKLVAVISRLLVKEWKRMVDEWLKMQKLIKGGESIQNPRNPPPTEKQTAGPITNQPRSLIVRIKLKKVDSKGPVIPDQKEDEVLKNTKPVSDETLKKVENIRSSSVETLMKPVPDGTLKKVEYTSSSSVKALKKPVPDETLKKVENISSSSVETLKKPVPDETLKKFESISSSSVETGIGISGRVLDQKLGSKETGRKIDSGNLKKRKIGDGDGVEEKLKGREIWMKKYYVEEKKRSIQLLPYDEQISLLSSTQIKEPLKRQIRRRR